MPEERNGKPECIPMVGMGQMLVVKDNQIAGAVLGSCIGLALIHRNQKLAVIGHIVLPESRSQPGPAGKFADTAIPSMLQLLEQQGARPSGVVAKMVGGASMFAGSGPLQIGEANIQTVLRLLDKLRISVLAQDVGGQRGRRMTLLPSTGELTVEIAGQPKKIL